MVVNQHSTTATYMYMYTSHHTCTSLNHTRHPPTQPQLPPSHQIHNYSYQITPDTTTHHTRHPPTQPQLPTSHQIPPAHNYSYLHRPKLLGLHSAHNHILSGACSDLTSSVATLRSSTYIPIALDAKRIEPQMKFSHHRPCSPIVSFENTSN